MPWIRATREPLRAAWAALGLAVTLAAAGCGEPMSAPLPASSSDEAPPRPGGTLRVASISEARNLDPAGPSDSVAVQAQQLMFAGLVDYDDQGRLVADLAEHWETQDEGRSYVFTLRPGVVMHDGEELTAEEVKRSAERALHPSTPDPNSSYFEGLAGYAAYASGRTPHLDGISVEGRYVVRFRLTEPDATFLPILAMHTLRPVCRSGGDRYSDAWVPCGAGPFKLPPGGWQRGTSLRLVRHERYFRPGLPYLDAVEWTYNAPVLTQRFRFEAGAIDVLRDITQADLSRFTSDPRWAPYGARGGDTRVSGEMMNTTVPPFDRVEIRRAVAAAIDREHYRLLKPDYMTVLTQLMPPGAPGYDPDIPGQRYDYPAALEHMRRAGYAYDPATGKGGWPDTIEYPLYEGGSNVYTAQLLQQDLAKIGLRIVLKLMSWPAFLAAHQRPDGAAISQMNWEMDYPDPSSYFEPLFTTSSIGTEAGNNSSRYSNPRYDQLVARAHHELDAGRRAALYREATGILCDDAPWAFTYAYHGFDLRQPYVHRYAPHPVWPLDVTRTWLDRVRTALEHVLGREAAR